MGGRGRDLGGQGLCKYSLKEWSDLGDMDSLTQREINVEKHIKKPFLSVSQISQGKTLYSFPRVFAVLNFKCSV